MTRDMTPMQQMITKQMVARFLAWPVPADVHPDGTPGLLRMDDDGPACSSIYGLCE